jgi:hypothetical protein
LDHQRLTGCAVAAWEAGELHLVEELADELLEHHRAAMVLALTIEQHLMELADAFSSAGLRAVVLKGPAVAHGLYPDPTVRPFGDLDLLVSADDWRRACELLIRHGYSRDLPEPRPGFDERFGKAATHSNGAGVKVDLHRTIVLGPFGLWLDPDELLRHTRTFPLGGRTIERLDPTGLLLNAVVHAALGTFPPLLLPLRDVVLAARQPDVEWTTLADWATRWHLGVAFRFAFAAVSSELGVEEPPQAGLVAPDVAARSDERAFRAYIERSRFGGVALASTRAIPGVRAKLSYLTGLVAPSRAFLRARSGGGPQISYVSRWSVPIRRLTARRGKHRGEVGHVRSIDGR